MDKSHISRHDVIERYLLGKLSEEEAAAFEDRFAFDKELLDEIELAEQMIGGLRGQPDMTKRAAAPEEAWDGPSRGRFEWAIAAFLAAFAILLPFIYFTDLAPASEFKFSAGRPDAVSAAVVMLERPRSTSSTPMTRILIETGPDAVVVLGVPVNGRLEAADLVVTLSSGTREVFSDRWTGGVDAEGIFYLSIPAAQLGSQDYTLTVREGPDSETFRFNAYRTL